MDRHAQRHSYTVAYSDANGQALSPSGIQAKKKRSWLSNSAFSQQMLERLSLDETTRPHPNPHHHHQSPRPRKTLRLLLLPLLLPRLHLQRLHR